MRSKILAVNIFVFSTHSAGSADW